MKKNKMDFDLENREWKAFKIGDIFDIRKVFGKPLDKYKTGLTPYITTSKTNNGLIGFAKESNLNLSQKNCISVDPISGTAFYHEYNFIGRGFSGASISLLYSDCLNKNNSLFICKAIEKTSKVKASYGYLFNSNRLKNGKINLPVNLNGEPDYDFMEQFIQHKEQEKQKEYQEYIQERINQLKNTQKTVSLNEKEWSEFEIKSIFTINSGVRLTKSDMQEGGKPFIGATDSNNGITKFVSNTNNSEDRNVLGVNYNGSVVENFYHPYIAIFSDDVKRLRLKNIEGNEFLYLFMKTIILKQKVKYRYGYKFNSTRMKKQKIMLPINKNNEPDYIFMENYIKNLEYKKLTEYVKFKNLTLQQNPYNNI